jgi:hypothetical protein
MSHGNGKNEYKLNKINMSIKTRVGNIVTVINQNKKKGAADTYESVLLKSGKSISEFLFTKVELEVASSRARKNIEDTLEQSLFSKIVD